MLYTKSRPLDSPSKLRNEAIRLFARSEDQVLRSRTAKQRERSQPAPTWMQQSWVFAWNGILAAHLVVKESESSIPCSQSPKQASECGWVDAAAGSRWTGKGRGSARFACRRGLESGLFLPVATVRGVHYPPRRNSGTCPRIILGGDGTDDAHRALDVGRGRCVRGCRGSREGAAGRDRRDSRGRRAAAARGGGGGLLLDPRGRRRLGRGRRADRDRCPGPVPPGGPRRARRRARAGHPLGVSAGLAGRHALDRPRDAAARWPVSTWCSTSPPARRSSCAARTDGRSPAPASSPVSSTATSSRCPTDWPSGSRRRPSPTTADGPCSPRSSPRRSPRSSSSPPAWAASNSASVAAATSRRRRRST